MSFQMVRLQCYIQEATRASSFLYHVTQGHKCVNISFGLVLPHPHITHTHTSHNPVSFAGASRV